MTEILWLNRRLLHDTVGDWLVALALIALIVLVVAVLKPLISGRLESLARRRQRAHEALVRVIRATRLWLVLPVAIYFGGQYLELSPRIDRWLARLAMVALCLQAACWAIALVDDWVARSRASDGEAATRGGLSALHFIVRTVLWSVALLLALDNVGFHVTTLAAGLGIGGIAIALAIQNILGDLLASLSIVLDKPFVRGDFIVLDNFMGTVDNIGIKTTRLQSIDGEQIVLSNSDLVKSRLRNYKQMRERRAVFGFGVLYATTPDKLEEIPAMVRGIVESVPGTRFERAHFKAFAESSLSFEVVYTMLDPDFSKLMDAQQRINLALIRAFDTAGIGFAQPARALHIEGPIEVTSRFEDKSGAGATLPSP